MQNNAQKVNWFTDIMISLWIVFLSGVVIFFMKLADGMDFCWNFVRKVLKF